MIDDVLSHYTITCHMIISCEMVSCQVIWYDIFWVCVHCSCFENDNETFLSLYISTMKKKMREWNKTIVTSYCCSWYKIMWWFHIMMERYHIICWFALWVCACVRIIHSSVLLFMIWNHVMISHHDGTKSYHLTACLSFTWYNIHTKEKKRK